MCVSAGAVKAKCFKELTQKKTKIVESAKCVLVCGTVLKSGTENVAKMATFALNPLHVLPACILV